MSRYRRARVEGGTFFFTLVLTDRSDDLLVREIDRFRRSYADARARRPFETVAICVLPDHLHAIWTLPPGDGDFATRWSVIKAGFSRDLAPAGLRSPGQVAKRDKGIWQRRHWEHVIRDDADLARHVDYIHYNPVKHGCVSAVRDWPHSSFHHYVARGLLPSDWGGDLVTIEGAFGE
ncbi:transposase [Rhodoplanes elegans]|uniref:Transposase n=1 Tax=Rhodoplanes elegans TaxID=29408 RepID=A0A327KNR7_9BRAD|nr:transposase [Rhodoplanes elegans]MBK5958529.1 transposase [Rhodoplanes elegans]RAI39634.1 transposase [Rhodoplanes elegans]